MNPWLLSKRFGFDPVELGVLHATGGQRAEIRHLGQREDTAGGSRRRFYAEEICAFDIVNHERASFVGGLVGDFHVAEFQIPRMLDVKTVRRKLGAEHVRIRAFVFVFRWLEGGHFLGGTAAVLEIQVADLDVLNGVSGNAAQNRRQMSSGVVAHDVAQDDAMQRAKRGFLAGHACARQGARKSASR